MVQVAEHRFGNDTVAVADPMVAGRWREPIVGWSGDARPETGVRPSPIANPRWGAPRIHGELLKLGIDVCQATVAKYMGRRSQCAS